MIHLKIEFHTNQYQACAWGNHHSEGVIDWPPSPWRILRALVAGAYNVNLKESYRPTLKKLLHKLARVLPEYHLPPVTYIQHRSARPQVDANTARVKPGKVLYSAGLLMSSSQNLAYVRWSLALSEVEELVLSLCLAGITYFGRKESVATLSLVAESPDPNAKADPLGDNDSGASLCEHRIIVVADPDIEVEALWDALNLSTYDNYTVSRTAVFPGMQQATYRVNASNLQVKQPVEQKPQVVTLSVLASPRLPLNLTLKVTDKLHQALVKRCPAPIFTGKEMGLPRSGSHDHTIFQCLPDRTGRYIERIKLYSKEGYGQEALATIANCSKLFGVARDRKISLSLADFEMRSQKKYDSWISCSPFFLFRHPATRRGVPRMLTDNYQKDGPEHQVLTYIQYLDWLDLKGKISYQEHPEGLALLLNENITAIATCKQFPKFWEWEASCRKGKKVGTIGYQVKLRFLIPVSGPISLGYATHYGLGAMVPMRDTPDVENARDWNNDLSIAVLD